MCCHIGSKWIQTVSLEWIKHDYLKHMNLPSKFHLILIQWDYFRYILQGKPLTALCWGHNDRRLFVAAGFNLHVAWVMKKVPPLQFLCQRVIQICIRNEKLIRKLPLPPRLQHSVQTMFSPTIKVKTSKPCSHPPSR